MNGNIYIYISVALWASHKVGMRLSSHKLLLIFLFKTIFTSQFLRYAKKSAKHLRVEQTNAFGAIKEGE